MANQLETVLGRQINSVSELKKAIKELQDSLVGLDTTSEEYKSTSQKLIVATDALKNTTKAGAEANIAAKDSVIGMQKEYNKLYDTYKKLSDEERKSEFGKGMAENLNKLSTQINESKKDVGNFTSNIGRYAEGATEAFQKMGVSIGGLQKPLTLATTGTKTLGTALKGLAANPIFLVITAFVAILVKAAEHIKENEELTNRLHEAMAAFQPVLDLISNVLDVIAELLVKVVEGFSELASKIMSLNPRMREQIKSHKELAKATNDLAKAQRQLKVDNSEKQAEIERLREEAAATDDVAKKTNLLLQARKKQEEVDQANIKMEKEKLRIMEEYASKTSNSAKDNEELAAQQAKVNEAIAQGERNLRTYNKQLMSMNSKDINVSIKIVEELEQKVKDAKEARDEALNDYTDAVEEVGARVLANTEQAQKLVDKANDVMYGGLEGGKKTYDEMTALQQLWWVVTNKSFDDLRDVRKYQKEANELMDEVVEDTHKLNEGFTNVEETSRSLSDAAEDLTEARNQLCGITSSVTATSDAQRDAAKRLVEDLQDYGKTEIDLLTKQYNEEYNLLKKYYGPDNGYLVILQQKYYDAVAEINRTNLLKMLQEDKQMRDEYLNVLAETNERLATSFRLEDLETQTIPTLEGFYKKVSNMGEEVIELIGEHGFAGLSDEYKELKDNAEALSVATGENITDFETLVAIIAKLQRQAQTFKGTLANMSIEALTNKANTDIYQQIGDMLMGPNANLDKIKEFVLESEYMLLANQKALYEEQLKAFSGTTEQKLAMLKEYYSVADELEQRHQALSSLQAERTAVMAESLIDMTDRMAGALSTYRSSQEQVIESELKAGKIDEAEAKKKKERLLKLQEIETAFSIATITADAAAGIFSIWRGYAEEKGKINPQTAAAAGVGSGIALAALNTKSLISAIAQTAGIAATATAQIAAARGQYITAKNNMEAETGGSDVTVGASPMLIDSTPYSYTREVQTVEEQETLNKPIYVTVTDIEEGLNHKVQVTDEVSF